MNHKSDSFLSVSSSPSFTSPTDKSFDLDNEISPTVLYAITLISIIVFVSALLHLLVRFLLIPRTGLNDACVESAGATTLHGHLQTQFNLHDSGVDQSFIDALPLIHYKTRNGLRHDVPFDCAVCLCEFKPEDELRLLPQCSHAFHVYCIDTWLLKNSTCPLCRDNLLLGLTASPSPAAPLLAVESDGESSRDSASHLGSTRFDDVVSEACESSGQNDESKPENDERVVLVKLGKFKNFDATNQHYSTDKTEDNDDGGTGRCLSMGYIEYVMPEYTLLQAHADTVSNSSFFAYDCMV